MDKQPKNKIVAFKVTDQDFKAITNYFDAKSMNKSEWIRKQVKALIDQDSIQ